MAAVVYKGSHEGRLPRLNEWHGARALGGQARIFENTIFKRGKKDMAWSFLTTREHAIDYPVDCEITVSLWKVIDTDAPIKAICDALEQAGVLENDRQIRHLSVRREYHKRDASDRVVVQLRVTGEG